MTGTLRQIEVAQDEANGPHDLRTVIKALRAAKVKYEITPPLKSTDKTVFSFNADNELCARIKVTLMNILHPEWPAERQEAPRQEAPRQQETPRNPSDNAYSQHEPRQEAPQSDTRNQPSFFTVMSLGWREMTSPKSGHVYRFDLQGVSNTLSNTQRDSVLNLLNKNGISASVIHSQSFNRDYIEIPYDNMVRLQELAVAEQDWRMVSSPRSGDAYRIPLSGFNYMQRDKMIGTLEQLGIVADAINSSTFNADFIEVKQSQFNRLEQTIIAAQTWKTIQSPHSGVVGRIDMMGMSQQQSDMVQKMLFNQGIASSVIHSQTFGRDFIEVPTDSLMRLYDITRPQGERPEGNYRQGPKQHYNA